MRNACRMFTGVKIAGYRGVHTANLEGFSALNVFVGPNASGKSALLEAIFVAASENPSALAFCLKLHREEEPLRWLFHKDTTRLSIELQGSIAEQLDGPPRLEAARSLDSLEISLGSSPGNAYTLEDLRKLGESNRFQTGARFVEAARPTVSLALLYTNAVQSGLRDEVFVLVKSLVPESRGLEILTNPNGTPELNVVFSDWAAPVSTLGDGLHSLIRQCLELASKRGPILLAEPEAFKHPAAIVKMASAIVAAQERGTQIFLTTHSLELIDALLSAKGKRVGEMALFRLALQNGTLLHSKVGGEEARDLRAAIEEDLR